MFLECFLEVPLGFPKGFSKVPRSCPEGSSKVPRRFPKVFQKSKVFKNIYIVLDFQVVIFPCCQTFKLPNFQDFKYPSIVGKCSIVQVLKSSKTLVFEYHSQKNRGFKVAVSYLFKDSKTNQVSKFTSSSSLVARCH